VKTEKQTKIILLLTSGVPPSQDLKIDLRVKVDPGVRPDGSKMTVNSTMIDKDLEKHVDKFIDQKEIIKHFIADDINVYKDD
jgi:hypothetical protein